MLEICMHLGERSSCFRSIFILCLKRLGISNDRILLAIEQVSSNWAVFDWVWLGGGLSRLLMLCSLIWEIVIRISGGSCFLLLTERMSASQSEVTQLLITCEFLRHTVLYHFGIITAFALFKLGYCRIRTSAIKLMLLTLKTLVSPWTQHTNFDSCFCNFNVTVYPSIHIADFFHECVFTYQS